jgi:hypothetical protein
MARCAKILLLIITLAGCFYPPPQKPLDEARTHLVLDSPYDKVWDAVHEVIVRNNYRVVTEDPDSGTVEAEAAGAFTLDDADCGKLRAIGPKYRAQPDPDATAIYDFDVKPLGAERSTVDVRGTYTAPLHIPFHPVRGGRCVSRGTQEPRLLRQIAERVRGNGRTGHLAEPAPVPPPARETVR